jgi:hypothetical protein
MNWPATPNGVRQTDKTMNDDRRDEATTNLEEKPNANLMREGPGGAPAAQNGTETDPRARTNRPLFSPDECQSLRSQWENLQAGFVDEPPQAVERADRLVAEAIENLREVFPRRQSLESQWHGEREVSTEDLRLAFRRYRSFFERLLTM